MLRRLTCFSVFLLAALRCAGAWPDVEWTREIELGFTTRAVRRGVEHSGAAVQPAVWLKSEDFRLGAAVRQPFSGSAGQAWLLQASTTRSLGAGWQAEFGLSHERLPHALGGFPAQATRVAGALSHSFGPGRLTLAYERDFSREADAGEISYGGDWALQSLGAFLQYRLYLGTQSGRALLGSGGLARVGDAYAYLGADFAVPYRIGGSTVLTAGLHWAGTTGQRPFWSPTGASPGAKVWCSVSLTREF